MATSNIDSQRGGVNRPEGSNAAYQGNEPAVNTKHQPGKIVGNDAAGEFHAQTLPPGSAPASRTFVPNTVAGDDTAPPVERYMKDGVRDPEAQSTSAADTLGGASSADVHTGLGHPGAGQTSAELRHDGQAHRNNPGLGGIEGRGGSASQTGINAHDPAFANQRALNDDNATVGRSDVPSAEERLLEGAQTVASENKIGRDTRAYGS